MKSSSPERKSGEKPLDPELNGLKIALEKSGFSTQVQSNTSLPTIEILLNMRSLDYSNRIKKLNEIFIGKRGLNPYPNVTHLRGDQVDQDDNPTGIEFIRFWVQKKV